jgi:hypothetical protein
MRKNVRYHYYVEGNCEKKLIDEFKKQQLPIISGKIDVFNAVQEEFTNTRLRMLPENTVVILVFDTDTGIVEILNRNLEILKKHPRVKETWCVMQVYNLEDEIKRSTDVKEIKDLLGSKSNKEYKHDFIIEKNLYDKLRRHQFDFERIWVTSPDNAFSVIKNCGEKIKKRGY